MANRYFKWYWQTLETAIKTVFCRVTFGANGAPTLDAVNSKGIVSVTRSSQGIFVFTFGTKSALQGSPALDTYVRLMNFNVTWDETGNSGTAPLAPSAFVSGNALATFGTSTLTLTLGNYTNGSATDPASTEVGLFEFILSDSNAP